MPRNSMPDNWEPPAPAWESSWQDTDDPLLTGCFGAQTDDSRVLDAWANGTLQVSDGPFSIERGYFVDSKGIQNHLYVAYWRLSAYQRWWADHARAWHDTAQLNDTGYWREVFAMPFDRFETLHSTENAHGIGVSAQTMRGPILEHGYPGGMRDRIPLSDTESLSSITAIDSSLPSITSDDGRRVVVTPPKNMSIIRSGQNWSACPPEQRDYYLQNVHPVLLEGMRFLRDNPSETNCYSMRFVDLKSEDWAATEQSFGLGYATDVYAFEDWAKSHPTHVAIFDSFMDMVAQFGEDLKLQLWHEVTALPGNDCEFEYIDCHSSTGLLSYV